MLKCVMSSVDPNDPCANPCEYNPFTTFTPYFFFTISMALACLSLWLLAVGLRTFEALYMITVFEGFMCLSGAISGNLVMNEKEGQPWLSIFLYLIAIGIICAGLYVLLEGERADNEGALLSRTMEPARGCGAQEGDSPVEMRAMSISEREMTISELRERSLSDIRESNAARHEAEGTPTKKPGSRTNSRGTRLALEDPDPDL
jgi:hypothetical protein